MSKINQIAQLIVIVSFFYYGTSCLIAKKMLIEFERYKLSPYRKMTGILQIAGSLGLICGFYFPQIGKIAALGLALQMFFGVIVRIRIKDSFLQMLPALIFFLINLFIFSF